MLSVGFEVGLDAGQSAMQLESVLVDGIWRYDPRHVVLQPVVTNRLPVFISEQEGVLEGIRV